MRLELEAVAGNSGARFHFMDVGLHRTPKLMPARLAEAIKEIESGGPTEIVMAYGLCSNGVIGLAGLAGLAIPRCHDCVGILLGSPERYLKTFRQYPGTMFLFAGMIEADFDPLSIVEKDYAPRLGLKKAMKGLALALHNYTHFAYIENGSTGSTRYKERFLENCRAFAKEPLFLEADMDYLKRLVHGPRTAPDFVVVQAGQPLSDEAFYENS